MGGGGADTGTWGLALGMPCALWLHASGMAGDALTRWTTHGPMAYLPGPTAQLYVRVHSSWGAEGWTLIPHFLFVFS